MTIFMRHVIPRFTPIHTIQISYDHKQTMDELSHFSYLFPETNKRLVTFIEIFHDRVDKYSHLSLALKYKKTELVIIVKVLIVQEFKGIKET